MKFFKIALLILSINFQNMYAIERPKKEINTTILSRLKTVAGCIAGGAVGYCFLRGVYYFHSRSHDYRNAHVCGIFGALFFSLLGGTMAWSATPEGIIHTTESLLEQAKRFTELVARTPSDTDLLLGLDKLSTSPMPRVMIFKELGSLRSQLVKSRKGLLEAQQSRYDLKEYCEYYTEQITLQLPLLERAFLLINGEPNWPSMLRDFEKSRVGRFRSFPLNF